MVSSDLLVIVFGIALGSIIGRISTKVFAALDFEGKKGKKARMRVK